MTDGPNIIMAGILVFTGLVMINYTLMQIHGQLVDMRRDNLRAQLHDAQAALDELMTEEYEDDEEDT